MLKATIHARSRAWSAAASLAEVTSLGLVQMTRKRIGTGLVEAFSTPCQACSGRGIIVHDAPVESSGGSEDGGGQPPGAPAGAGART